MSKSDKKAITKISRRLSLVLRHKPETIGLELDREGWAKVDGLLECYNRNFHQLTRELLEEVVRTNDKQRFSFSEDGKRIRANQGHSLDVDLSLAPKTPPDVLYHGTATRFLDEIYQQGLLPMSRQYVHLSDELETARKVGKRHGKLIVIVLDTKQMHKDGCEFFLSDNGVWLTESVNPKYFMATRE